MARSFPRCFDHNWRTLPYPEIVLGDAAASPFVAGTAFHKYSGQPSVMTTLHDAFPDKRIFFSEGSEFGVRGAAEMVAIFNNYASTYSAWVTMLDSNMQPNAGPFRPQPTMLELNAVTKEVTFRFEYFMTGQFSKFVRRGARRVLSQVLGSDDERKQGLSVVAFVNGDEACLGDNQNAVVVVVVNDAAAPASLRLKWGDQESRAVVVDPASVATFRWPLLGR